MNHTLAGKTLREIRLKQGLSLAEVAEKSRLPHSLLQDLEAGRKKPSARNLASLAAVLPLDAEMDQQAWLQATEGLGEKVRALRQARGLTLAGLSQLTGLSVAYLSELERGNTIPAVVTLKTIADAFNIPVSLLLTNERKSSLVGEKLQRLRMARGISQKELAARAGISPGLVAQLENNKVQASLATVQKIAEALGVSVCYLTLEQEEVEAVVGALSPELRELLYNPQVQILLGSICTMDREKLKLVLNFIEMLNNPRF